MGEPRAAQVRKRARVARLSAGHSLCLRCGFAGKVGAQNVIRAVSVALACSGARGINTRLQHPESNHCFLVVPGILDMVEKAVVGTQALSESSSFV